MSNSPLVDYTAISPNSSPRYKKIRKITPHHMAGVLSVETCGNVFSTSARQASSNYGIGYDGRVGLYVPEDRQAWTSASYSNDQEAVTIEVSNSSTGGDWPVSDVVWNKLVDLCVDICERNDIKGLSWTGGADGTLTCHYMFAATGCPGAYLKSRMGRLADEVNKRLNGSTPKGDDLKEIDIPKGNAEVYRLYNERHGHHMFTSSIAEKNSLAKSGWTYEGVAWKAPDTGSIAYRMYNPNNGQHMWTLSFNEASSLNGSGWVYEGANFASGREGVPIHRLYNPYNGDHMFTQSNEEKKNLVAGGWTYEGTAFYGAL